MSMSSMVLIGVEKVIRSGPWSIENWTNRCISELLLHQHFCQSVIREVIKKNEYFTVRLTVRGEGSTPPGLTVAFVKNLTLFSYGI